MYSWESSESGLQMSALHNKDIFTCKSKRKGGIFVRSIRTKLIAYFLVVILCVSLMTGVLVTVTTKNVLKDNIELTSSQTVTETLKGFQTYMRPMSQPVDLVTRR